MSVSDVFLDAEFEYVSRRGKMSVSDVFLDAEFEYVSRISPSHKLLHCIRLSDRTRLHMRVTGGL